MAIVIKEIKVVSTVEDSRHKREDGNIDSPELIRKIKELIQEEQRNISLEKQKKHER